ncbi:hypothetical protein OHN11_09765 [Serratia marcescens]|uniref:hypothetical protein n=1 Tax=Serratia marcescens TaxID=615 RepID=UPI00040D4B41|nr:hypothetical protein [Serratia marcescens]EME9756261.1 hypothetical protein [Serratia marcescens]MDM3533597.1 hypothetical protein [Serratia marcescens]MDM3540594.1 hypothetical protein [Serratia marcescens]
MTEVLTYEALKEKCDRLEQINSQTLQVKLTMAEAIKELTDRVNALAVENRELKKFGDKLNEMHNDLNGEGTGIQGRAEVVCQQAAIEAAMDEFDAITTPATDVALAAIQAQGVEKAAEYTAHESSRAEFINSDVSSAFAGLADDLMKLAANIREAK